MADVTMTLDEYEALRAMALNHECTNCATATPLAAKPKRKASAYSRRYAKAFKKVQKKFKKKNGGWMKDGFKRAQKEAHRIARRGN